METYKAALISGVKETEICEFEKKAPTAKQVLIKVAYCAICTLEQRIYGGVMKRYPFAGGHEVSGIVEGVGEDVSNVEVGDKVAVRLLTSCGECYYCRGGNENQCVISFKAAVHQGTNGPGGLAEYMLIDASAVYKMNPETELRYAALSEPLACCVHSINQANIMLGDDVVVVGVGIMGAFHIQLAKMRGARVIACEVDEERLALAKKLGASCVIHSGKEDAIQRIKELTEGRGADVVFCTAAIPQLAAESIEMGGKLSRIVLYSSFHPNLPVELDVNRVHSTETVITGSVNPNKRDFLSATRLLSAGLIDVSHMITAEYPLDKLEEAFTKALEPSSFRVVVKTT